MMCTSNKRRPMFTQDTEMPGTVMRVIWCGPWKDFEREGCESLVMPRRIPALKARDFAHHGLAEWLQGVFGFDDRSHGAAEQVCRNWLARVHGTAIAPGEFSTLYPAQASAAAWNETIRDMEYVRDGNSFLAPPHADPTALRKAEFLRPGKVPSLKPDDIGRGVWPGSLPYWLWATFGDSPKREQFGKLLFSEASRLAGRPITPAACSIHMPTSVSARAWNNAARVWRKITGQQTLQVAA